jgi:hypothetical protein
MKIAIAFSAVLLTTAAGFAQPLPIAYWRFPTAVPASGDNFKITPPIPADLKNTAGTAQITTNVATWDGTANPANSLLQGSLQYFSGSTLNALPGDTAGSALSIRGNTGNDSNGKWVQFQFDTTGYYTISMTWAERGTSTGPTSIGIEYSTDGVIYTTFGTFVPTNNSQYNLRTVDLSSVAALQNTPTAFVRFIFSGFTSAAGGYRFENVQVLPTPGAMALLGLGGLVAGRRRRA